MNKEIDINTIKQLKNILATKFSFIKEIRYPRGYTNYCVEDRISKNFFGRTFKEIKLKFNLPENASLFEYMDQELLSSFGLMLIKYAYYIDSKNGINLSKICLNIKEYEYDLALREKNAFIKRISDKNENKKYTPYTYFKSIMNLPSNSNEDEDIEILDTSTSDEYEKYLEAKYNGVSVDDVESSLTDNNLYDGGIHR